MYWPLWSFWLCSRCVPSSFCCESGDIDIRLTQRVPETYTPSCLNGKLRWHVVLLPVGSAYDVARVHGARVKLFLSVHHSPSTPPRTPIWAQPSSVSGWACSSQPFWNQLFTCGMQRWAEEFRLVVTYIQILRSLILTSSSGGCDFSLTAPLSSDTHF